MTVHDALSSFLLRRRGCQWLRWESRWAEAGGSGGEWGRGIHIIYI